MRSDEAIGTVVRVEERWCVVVRLDNGDTVRCRISRVVRRNLRFGIMPHWRRVRIRFRPIRKDRTPLIVELL